MFIDNNGIAYYKSSEVADMLGRTMQTIVLWDKHSDAVEAQGEPRYIPKPIRIKGNKRYWTEEQFKEIKKFASTISKGTFGNLNTDRLGKRGIEIKRKRRERQIDDNLKKVSRGRGMDW